MSVWTENGVLKGVAIVSAEKSNGDYDNKRVLRSSQGVAKARCRQVY